MPLTGIHLECMHRAGSKAEHGPVLPVPLNCLFVSMSGNPENQVFFVSPRGSWTFQNVAIARGIADDDKSWVLSSYACCKRIPFPLSVSATGCLSVVLVGAHQDPRKNVIFFLSMTPREKTLSTRVFASLVPVAQGHDGHDGEMPSRETRAGVLSPLVRESVLLRC